MKRKRAYLTYMMTVTKIPAMTCDCSTPLESTKDYCIKEGRHWGKEKAPSMNLNRESSYLTWPDL